jgi:HSP20 family molecular chaperone IbpA
MANAQELSVQQKKEVATKDEKTVRARYYAPPTDIFETEGALTLVMEMPGVDKKDLTVTLENEVLRVEGRIDFSKYEGLEPLYAEYNVGHFARSFTLGDRVDREKISAQLGDGVLTLTLEKAEAAKPRRITIG